MRGTIRVLLGLISALVVCLALTLGGTASASEPTIEPIGPGQHFVGIVNGGKPTTTAMPVVYTVCAGPIWPTRTGPVAGGQTLSVAHVAQGGGYTGLFSQVYAWFVQDASPGGPQQVKFLTYNTKLSIPAAVRVPCDGTGQVEFSPCPHLAPCAAGWTPMRVTVRFVNLAV